MKMLVQIVLLGLLSTFSGLAGDKEFYDVVFEKSKRNKIGDFIAVASIKLDRDLESFSDSPLLQSMVREEHFLVIPCGDVTLGIRTLWCAPEDFDAVSNWLRSEGARFSEINSLFEGNRYFYDERELKTGHNKTRRSSSNRPESK